VNAVAFTPGGRSVVSASEDATALVWDISDLLNQRKDVQPIQRGAKSRWDDLADDDAHTAYRATWALSVASAIPFLRETSAPPHPRPEGNPRSERADRTARSLADAAPSRHSNEWGRPSPRRLERISQGNLDASRPGTPGRLSTA